jgi:hypothetical protein
MDFTSCSIFERILNLFDFTGHMALSNRWIPVQPDRASEPLDLK